MFEYSTGRFVNPARIIGASIYTKEDKMRVAIDLDVAEASKKSVFSDVMLSTDQARSFIKTIPCVSAEK